MVVILCIILCITAAAADEYEDLSVSDIDQDFIFVDIEDDISLIELDIINEITYAADDGAEDASAIAEEAVADDGQTEQEELPLKYICLTFDDGPSTYTKAILDILEENDIRATFCVLGKRVKQYPDEVRRAAAMGNDIIGHSWDHTMLVNLTNAQMTDSIVKTYDAIANASGIEPLRMYRAPGGTTSPRLLALSEELGFMLLHWTVGSNDYALKDEKKIRNAIYYNVHEGSIILCHDIYKETVKAMRTVIPELIDQGFTFVTISEYLEIYGDEIVPGTVFRGHDERSTVK
jgi:peptidoglycan/xylan/chitin deacetylase (PgdA/CDA1 family)